MKASKQSILAGDSSKKEDEFVDNVVTSFLSADIPLHKLRHPAIKSLFTYLGHTAPSESGCRRRVPNLGQQEFKRVTNLLVGKEVFMVIDESEVAGRKFINTLVGDIEVPSITYLIGCQVCSAAVNQRTIIHAVDDAVRRLDTDRNNLVLLLSDAARYMTAAGAVLKQLYPRLFHVTCVAHMIHNCAERVRANFKDVDHLIASLKAAVVKNKDRRELFADIGYPPQPVLTRWATWLNAALYYADKLPQVKTIVEQFEGEGILVARAKEATSAASVPASLLAIKRDYECLVGFITKCESSSYSMAEANSDLSKLHFGEDPCGIRMYLEARQAKNSDLVAINNMGRAEISPALFAKLQKCQATSAAVERSFSLLKKVLAKDRNFVAENVWHYMALYYNAPQDDC